jgi:uncharacterized iron-regulated membrane protein
MNLLRKVVFWGHLVVGVIAGIIILFMATTGALIAFEKQILDLAESKMRIVTQVGQEALTTQTLIAKVKEAKPNAKISGLVIQSDPKLSAIVSLGREGTLFVDPYTGEIKGEGSKALRTFFKTTTELHRWLALQGSGRDTGKLVTGIGSLCFFFLALSGIFIWLPKSWTRQQLRAITVLRLNLKGHARNFNLHNVIGIWALSIILIITITGIIMSFDWASNLLYTITSSPNPRANNQQSKSPANKPRSEQPEEVPEEVFNNLNAFFSEAKKAAPPNWKIINLRFPTNEKTPVRAFINEGNYWQNSQLSIDQKTIQVANLESYESLSNGRKLNSLAHPVHTGEVLGIFGQVFVFFASIGTIFLVCTGFLLSYHRLKTWLNKRAKIA